MDLPELCLFPDYRDDCPLGKRKVTPRTKSVGRAADLHSFLHIGIHSSKELCNINYLFVKQVNSKSGGRKVVLVRVRPGAPIGFACRIADSHGEAPKHLEKSVDAPDFSSGDTCGRTQIFTHSAFGCNLHISYSRLHSGGPLVPCPRRDPLSLFLKRPNRYRPLRSSLR
jgi:hypothetical protein